MKNSLSLLLCLIGFAAFSQFEVYQTGKKTGLKYNSEIVYKPKKDSIVCLDDSVATVYQKKKVLYVNQSGDKVYKAKRVYATPFIGGNAFIKDKHDLYNIINSRGEEVEGHIFIKAPVKYGRMMLAESSRKTYLYSSQKELLQRVDTIIEHGKWIEVMYHKIEHYTYYTKKNIFKKEQHTGEKNVYFKRVYDPIAEKLEVINISTTASIHNYLVCYLTNDKITILEHEGKYRIDSVESIVPLSEELFVMKKNKLTSLINGQTGNSIFSGDFDSVAIMPNSFYAFKKDKDDPQLYIYSKDGKLIKDQFAYVDAISRDRHIFEKDSMQYIGNEFGKKLSGDYYSIGDESEGYRIVFHTASYQYINDFTYQTISRQYPLMTYEPNAGGGGRRRRKGIIRGLVEMTANIVRAVTFQRPKRYGSGGSVHTNGKKFLEKGRPFQDGLVKVCLSHLDDSNNYTEPIHVTNEFKLFYTYMDTTGNYINNEKYNDVQDFHNGYAWVKYKDYYYLLDKTGKRKSIGKFSYVKRDDNGYYKVSYAGKDGLVSPDFKIISKCTHFLIYFSEEHQHYYEDKYGEKLIIHQL
ncbi:WG repeat-containing protein [Paracrocinitomix mangrovi]|uniref:WG repeat-containing protein n=1 Tax=Paracrocinitomix mangrovi TaxID=2862509 RepID=UPI001C8E1E8C|nr:WG repeat-containing protein [Paracrocinitomix mangrovi]UKN02683.1 WG repeat-containing protein [Paracrocinitomix mangrovi]